MIRIADDTAPGKIVVTPVEVKDAEGNLITPDKTIVESDNDAVFEVTGGSPETGADGTPTGNTEYDYAVGSPGDAVVKNVVVIGGEETIVSSQHFAVTVGKPASVTGGAMSFPGLPADDGQ